MKQAVRRVSGEECEITGASRTDSGAHALGQVCHFDSDVAIKTEDWPRVLNKVLPDDLSVLKAKEVPKTFHSRQTALKRKYRYRILVGGRDPLRGRFSAFYGRPVDVALMDRLAQSLLGEIDFRAFSEEVPKDAHTFRRLYKIGVRQVKDEVHIDVVGNAFLRGMMRRIAGGLLEAGRGHRTEPDFLELTDPKKRELIQWPVVMPAKGLTLLSVAYGHRMGDNRIHSRIEDPNDLTEE